MGSNSSWPIALSETEANEDMGTDVEVEVEVEVVEEEAGMVVDDEKDVDNVVDRDSDEGKDGLMSFLVVVTVVVVESVKNFPFLFRFVRDFLLGGFIFG